MPDEIYVLPDLPYDEGALEPYISGQLMELHHAKHHATYVKGANTALAKLYDTQGKGDFTGLSLLEPNLAFNVSGPVLHSVFWTNLSPDGGGIPSGDLADVIDDTFGGFADFRTNLWLGRRSSAGGSRLGTCPPWSTRDPGTGRSTLARRVVAARLQEPPMR